MCSVCVNVCALRLCCVELVRRMQGSARLLGVTPGPRCLFDTGNVSVSETTGHTLWDMHTHTHMHKRVLAYTSHMNAHVSAQIQSFNNMHTWNSIHTLIHTHRNALIPTEIKISTYISINSILGVSLWLTVFLFDHNCNNQKPWPLEFLVQTNNFMQYLPGWAEFFSYYHFHSNGHTGTGSCASKNILMN